MGYFEKSGQKRTRNGAELYKYRNSFRFIEDAFLSLSMAMMLGIAQKNIQHLNALLKQKRRRGEDDLGFSKNISSKHLSILMKRR